MRLRLMNPGFRQAERRLHLPFIRRARLSGSVHFARQGLWYDYLGALLEAVDAAPDDKALLARLGGSLKREKLIWKADGNIDELVTPREKR